MFDLAERPLVWITVKWSMLKPHEDETLPAVEHEVSLELEVEVKDRDELITLAEDIFGLAETKSAIKDDKRPPLEIISEKRDAEVKQFLGLVSNWRKFKEGGKPVDFTPENVKRLLAVAGFTNGFQTAYFLACAGKAETREGN